MTDPWHQRLTERLPRWLHRRALRFEAAIDDEVSRFARSLPPGTWVLDAGAGEGEDVRYFPHCRYVGVDLAIGDPDWDYSRLDVQADLGQLPFQNQRFGAALNIVVLEHTNEPERVLAEIARVLEPCAPLLLVVPQEWAVHQSPHDYFRYTRHGLEWLLGRTGWQPVRIEPVGGFFTLFGRRLLEAVLYFQGGWRWLLFPFAVAICGPAGLLVPAMDFLDRDRNSTLGYICIAKKS